MDRNYIKRDMRRKAEEWIDSICESDELGNYKKIFYENFIINALNDKRYRVIIEIEEDN